MTRVFQFAWKVLLVQHGTFPSLRVVLTKARPSKCGLCLG